MNEFSCVQGVTVPSLDGIHECYEISRREDLFYFAVNISAERIEPLVKRFCAELAEPCFLILEIPTKEAEECRLRSEKTDPFHCDVYYCDGLSKETLLQLIEKHGELLIHDGLACFGVASHTSGDELYLGKYKIASLFTRDEQRYQTFMREMGIPPEEHIKTVWDTFTRETPGTSRAITVDGKSIYDVLEELKEHGVYFAERRAH